MVNNGSTGPHQTSGLADICIICDCSDYDHFDWCSILCSSSAVERVLGSIPSCTAKLKEKNMCVVSMVTGGWTNPLDPNYIPIPTIQKDPDLAKQMLEIIKKLDALDKKVGAIDCSLDDDYKEKYIKLLEKIANAD